MTTRRGFLGSILASCAAPAIVKAESLMIVRPVEIIVPQEPKIGVYSKVTVDSRGRVTATSAEDQLQILCEEHHRKLADLFAEDLYRVANRKSIRSSFLLKT